MFRQLITAISDLQTARQAATDAKERWTDLMQEGSAEQGAAKQAFLAQLRLDYLLSPFKPTGLAALAAAWVRAAAMHDAARRIVEFLRSAESVEDFERTLEDADGYRNPDAWKQSVAVYRLAFVVMVHWSDDVAERISESAHAANRHLLAVYDRLSEDLQVLLEDLHYSNTLAAELAELDSELCRQVRDAIGMLVRQRQLQPETKPQASPAVATAIETEEETSDGFGG